MRSKTIAPRTWPETTSSHCYDWISPETVIRLALAAYYATSRELDHLPDDPSGEDLTFNNGRESFAEDLAEDFRLRVDAYGSECGIPTHTFCGQGRTLHAKHGFGGLDYAVQQLAVRHGPRIDDPRLTAKPRILSARPNLATGPGHDIHCALSMPRCMN